MSNAYFCELASAGLISFSGEDATPFLQSQLTSDVAALTLPRTQYSGYCSPKGRLLATFLVWRRESEILLVLPGALRESIQSRLAKYVLRARVKVADASTSLRLFGLAGEEALGALGEVGERIPAGVHEVASATGLEATRLPLDRYLLLVPSAQADAVRDALARSAEPRSETAWAASEVEAGFPVITAATQEQFVPQMVNLDLIGGVSYSKGCYPGQEIVARTHYLGKLKQRMYRVRVDGEILRTGDPVYSARFGSDQASGTILYAPDDTLASHDALAVLQRSAVDHGPLHLRSLGGPVLDLVPLPYTLPD